MSLKYNKIDILKALNTNDKSVLSDVIENKELYK